MSTGQVVRRHLPDGKDQYEMQDREERRKIEREGWNDIDVSVLGGSRERFLWQVRLMERDTSEVIPVHRLEVQSTSKAVDIRQMSMSITC